MSPGKTIRTALIGTGQMAETIHLPLLSSLDEFDVRLLVDPVADPARLDMLAANAGCPWSRTSEAITADTFDLAVIATPVTTHSDIALSLLKSGVNVFVEKPLTHSTVTAKELIAEADTRGVRAFCGQVRRFFPNVVTARRLLAGGIIGEIKSVSCAFGGLYGWNRRYFDKPGDPNAIINEGVLFDVGSHAIDTVCYALEPLFSDAEVNGATTDDLDTQADVRIAANLKRQETVTTPLEITLSNTCTLANLFWFCGQNGTLMLSANISEPPVFVLRGDKSAIKLNDTVQTTGNPFVQQFRTIANALQTGEASSIDAVNILQTVSILSDAQAVIAEGPCPWLDALSGGLQ